MGDLPIRVRRDRYRCVSHATHGVALPKVDGIERVQQVAEIRAVKSMRIKVLALVMLAATCLAAGQSPDKAGQSPDKARQSPDKASVLKRAQAGDVAAQIKIGNMYAIGDGVHRDPDKAMDWFKKAADQGSAEGQYRLGGMYDVARATKQDPETAITWYTL